MSGERQDIARTARGRYNPGFKTRLTKAAERAQLESEIIAELGADLTATDRVELRQAVDLLTRRPSNHVDAVRCSNAGSRIIAKVRARIKQREENKPSRGDAVETARAMLDRLERGDP